MRKVSEKDYHMFITWAKANTANTVYPSSIAEGIQSGDIYVNDDADVETVLFWHHCGFGYISGKPSYDFLNDIYSVMTSDHNRKRLVLITSDEEVADYFRDKEVLLDSRAEYSYLSDRNISATDITGFRIEQIDEENLSRIEGRIIPSFSWKTSDQFLKHGFGYIALDQERVCAIAFSAAVSSDEIDIGVETHEDYRRKGLAAILAGRMCERILKIGKKPVWAHSISNTGSMNTALKCGFVKHKVNTVIRRRNSD